MIAWLLLTNWASQIAWVIFGAWFLNGLRKAIMRPRVTYVAHVAVNDHGTLVTVRRQELIPPWRTLDEVWLLGVYGGGKSAIRESDGKCLMDGDRDDIGSPLARRLHALVRVQKARAKETENVLKDEP